MILCECVRVCPSLGGCRPHTLFSIIIHATAVDLFVFAQQIFIPFVLLYFPVSYFVPCTHYLQRFGTKTNHLLWKKNVPHGSDLLIRRQIMWDLALNSPHLSNILIYGYMVSHMFESI